MPEFDAVRTKEKETIRYLSKATEAAMKAATVNDPDAKSAFLTIAESYQLLARLTEQETAGGQIGESSSPGNCHIVDKAKNE